MVELKTADTPEAGDARISGDFSKLGVPFGGPHKEDYNILGSILGTLSGKAPSRLNDAGMGSLVPPHCFFCCSTPSLELEFHNHC